VIFEMIRQESLNLAGALIGVLLVGVLAFLAWALVFVRVPPENETAMNVLLGILSTQVGIVVGFYFGSSLGNKKQAETLDKMAETARTVSQAAIPTPSMTVASGEQVIVEGKE
jgi:Tfp pilus assembly protein PilN